MAFAVSVLPVPGLPYNSTPVGQGTMFRVPVNTRRIQCYNEYLWIHTESENRGIMGQGDSQGVRLGGREGKKEVGNDRGRQKGRLGGRENGREVGSQKREGGGRVGYM